MSWAEMKADLDNLVPIDCLKEQDVQKHIDFEDWQPAAWVSCKIHFTTSMAPGFKLLVTRG